tara:strand:+ start:100 stop:510 length:411 start_codon:yes stop_codon:yes gene_type:complete
MNIVNESEDPQFIILTKKNKDEFSVWCLTKLWDDNLNINDEFLNYYMELKLNEWVDQNHPWMYCYICVLDEFKLQKKAELEENNRKEWERKRKEKEEMRPSNIEKRRKLFADKALERLKKSNKGYEKTRCCVNKNS